MTTKTRPLAAIWDGETQTVDLIVPQMVEILPGIFAAGAEVVSSIEVR